MSHKSSENMHIDQDGNSQDENSSVGEDVHINLVKEGSSNIAEENENLVNGVSTETITKSISEKNSESSYISTAGTSIKEAEAVDDNLTIKISDHSSNFSLMCRICYDDTLDEPIISPCKCKGSIGMVHKSCLEKWLAESNTNRCDLCFFKFETERTTKFSVEESLYRWLRYPPTSFAFPIRDMRSDMITCVVLIPFSISLIYLCLFAAEYYNRQTFATIPVAKWTAISVMFMGKVIVLGFCTWIYLVLRYHSRVWYFWWQRETLVRIHIPDFAPHT